MACVNSQEIILKIPIDLRMKIVRILKHCPFGIKFKEFSALMQMKYNLNLELFSSNTDEVVLAVNDGDNQKFLNESRVQHIKDELEEFRDLLLRIDFKGEFKDFLQPVPSPDFSTKYVKIKISIEKPIKTHTKTFNENFFDCYPWKINAIHQIFMGHIYDPSKFWISFVPVDQFQKSLWEYYDENKNDLGMNLSDISIGLNCVVGISDLYYRARVVRPDIRDCSYFRVFLFDFGMTVKAGVTQLFKMHESFEKFAALGVRAMLTNVSTVDEEMWPQKSVNRFVQLTEDKNLFAQIVSVHKKRKILEIYLFDKDAMKKDKVFSINYRMVHEGLAKVAWYVPPEEVENNPRKNQYKPKRQFMYLFPPFEYIENGIIPSTVNSVEELKRCVPWDMLFRNLYEYENTKKVTSKT